MTNKMREAYELDVLVDIALAEYRVSRDPKYLEEAEAYMTALKLLSKEKSETLIESIGPSGYGC